MHAEAFSWVAQHAGSPASVIDAGGRNVNGSPRSLFPNATYLSVDIRPGDGVDIVADFAQWLPDEPVEAVICCEVAEHTAEWPLLIDHAAKSLLPGGRFIFTAAGPGRAPHSAEDGCEVRPGEHYANVDPNQLEQLLTDLFETVTVDVLGPDVRAIAIKGTT